MKRKAFTASGDWVAYFYENAQTAASWTKPSLAESIPESLRDLIAESLPAWQLGKTSNGRHLRAAARQYALEHDDMAFLSAIDLLILEEQRHGAALGEWMDLVGIPRKSRDLGDSLFRSFRYAIPNYAAWAAVVVMVESAAEIYLAAVRRVSPCPSLQAECARILADEAKHIQFQCEHLAHARRRLPRPVRWLVSLGELVFYAGACAAVWAAHGRLLRASGLTVQEFARLAARKHRVMQGLANPEGYEFPTEYVRPLIWPIRVRE